MQSHVITRYAEGLLGKILAVESTQRTSVGAALLVRSKQGNGVSRIISSELMRTAMEAILEGKALEDYTYSEDGYVGFLYRGVSQRSISQEFWDRTIRQMNEARNTQAGFPFTYYTKPRGRSCTTLHEQEVSADGRTKTRVRCLLKMLAELIDADADFPAIKKQFHTHFLSVLQQDIKK
mgnify:CR=1 FL=1